MSVSDVNEHAAPEDFKIRATLQHDVQLWKLQPGDVLLCRPSTVLSQHDTARLHQQLNANLAGADIRVLIVPAKWDLAVASYEDVPRDIVEGLVSMLQDLNG